MSKIIPKIAIDGKAVPYLDGKYQLNGGLTAATLQFTLPLTYASYKKLWNKEVTFYLGDYDSVPLFRGYIKRVKETLDDVEVFSQDVLGYMLKGGNPEKAKIALTNDENLDGLTAGAAIKKAIKMALLNTKVGTDMIGDTTPTISSSSVPFRGTLGVLDIIKELLTRAIDNSGTVPRPNIARVVDDGSSSQLIIELESDLDTSPIQHVFTEYDNISTLKVINRKLPTIVIVNGKNKVKGTFSHDSAVAAYDRNYLEVTNDSLESPAECKDFAQKIFRANLKTQYEYGIETFEGAHLNENDVVRIEASDPRFSGNYRVQGKSISFSSDEFNIGIIINKKPPTLAEFISQQDN
tara:strand:+ start:4204 stop:5256 length:1053 start_codon:yes stop_codon:yes gene_type:complete